MDISKSQFDSFLFWRQPIQSLHLSDLEDLLSQPTNRKEAKEKASSVRSLEEEEMTEFSSFNYWRAPIADVDALLADLNLLL